jgi:aspartyl aminopeptidase
MTEKDKKIDSLLTFLKTSPTAWHAVINCVKELKKAGFTELKEGSSWHLKEGGSYYVIRNGSSIAAFVLPKKKPASLHIAASHTDSPSFRIKPNAEFIKENMTMLGLEVYGGPMFSSWLNRDLGIAGRIIYRDKHKKEVEELVQIENCPVIIPQLAIHLDKKVNEAGPILNKQEQLAAIIALNEKKEDKKAKGTLLLNLLKHKHPISKLLSAELFLYPIESPGLVGLHHEMISAYRIDSLCSVHAILDGLLHAAAPSNDRIKMAVFWDSEEIGSHTAQGAGSPFLIHLIERITLALGLGREDYFKLLSHSLCASVDLVHSVHPNYADKHEPRHAVLMDHGIVIKSSAENRYASDARSIAAIVSLCVDHDIPYQKYVARGDISCGSTVGPIHANLSGMSTVDIGCTQLSMHSARELTSVKDHLSMCKLIAKFL